MKRLIALWILVLLVVFALNFTVVFAQSETPPVASDTIGLAGLLFASLVNIPGFLAVFGNLLKFIKVLPDTYAPTYNFWANILVYAGIFVLVLLGKTDVLAPIDNAFAGINSIVLNLLILLGGSGVSMGLTAKYHSLLKHGLVPIFGTSHSLKNLKK